MIDEVFIDLLIDLVLQAPEEADARERRPRPVRILPHLWPVPSPNFLPRAAPIGITEAKGVVRMRLVQTADLLPNFSLQGATSNLSPTPAEKTNKRTPSTSNTIRCQASEAVLGGDLLQTSPPPSSKLLPLTQSTAPGSQYKTLMPVDFRHFYRQLFETPSDFCNINNWSYQTVAHGRRALLQPPVADRYRYSAPSPHLRLTTRYL